MHRALIVVDIQNDFCPGGSLAVDGGDQVAVNVSDWIAAGERNYDLVVATMDWHPRSDESEAGFDHFSDQPDYVASWPPHCVQGTLGAAFHRQLTLPDDALVVRKGQTSAAYSGFEGADETGRSLETILRDAAVDHLDIVGLATDHCIRATALDAAKLGFTVNVRTSLIAGVAPETSEAALVEMADAGVALV